MPTMAARVRKIYEAELLLRSTISLTDIADVLNRWISDDSERALLFEELGNKMKARGASPEVINAWVSLRQANWWWNERGQQK